MSRDGGIYEKESMDDQRYGYCNTGDQLLFDRKSSHSLSNYRLKQSIHTISKPPVTLNEIVPFEWDIVYTFAPYTSRSEIEEIIGFKSNAIQETVSEGMVQLLFVKDNAACGSICGYSENLGYSVHFSDKVKLTDNKQFDVDIQDDIVYLTEK